MTSPEAPDGTAKEALLLLPGLLCDATVWRHQLAALSDDYAVKAADGLVGDSISAMAAKLLDQAPPRLSVAGHSMGARVALEMIRMAPERIDRLALLDTGVHPVREGEPARRQILVDLAFRDGMRALAEQWLPPMVHAPNFAAGSELRRALFAMVERMSPELHCDQIHALLTRPPAESVLSAIQCPTLIGVGEFDAWSPLEAHREMKNRIANARLVVFTDSGHMAPMEAPGAVTEALRDWMRSPNPRAGLTGAYDDIAELTCLPSL